MGGGGGGGGGDLSLTLREEDGLSLWQTASSKVRFISQCIMESQHSMLLPEAGLGPKANHSKSKPGQSINLHTIIMPA